MSDNATQTCNKLRLDLMNVLAGKIFHAGASAAISTPSATDVPSGVTLANAIKASLNSHFTSTVDATAGTGVHAIADATNGITMADATGLSDLPALVAAIRAAAIAHMQLAAPHFKPDGANQAIASRLTGDVAYVLSELNDIKAKVNAHYAAALNSQVAA